HALLEHVTANGVVCSEQERADDAEGGVPRRRGESAHFPGAMEAGLDAAAQSFDAYPSVSQLLSVAILNPAGATHGAFRGSSFASLYSRPSVEPPRRWPYPHGGHVVKIDKLRRHADVLSK